MPPRIEDKVSHSPPNRNNESGLHPLTDRHWNRAHCGPLAQLLPASSLWSLLPETKDRQSLFPSRFQTELSHLTTSLVIIVYNLSQLPLLQLCRSVEGCTVSQRNRISAPRDLARWHFDLQSPGNSPSLWSVDPSVSVSPSHPFIPAPVCSS